MTLTLKPARLFPALALSAALAFGLAGCGDDHDDPPLLTVDAAALSALSQEKVASILASCPGQPLSAAETASLLYIRQEEQLALDVYGIAAATWSQPLFANIAASEATHVAAVLRLLERYALPDPLSGLAPGTYASQELQTLFASLSAQSRESLAGAVLAGLQIEERDIRDITVQMATADNCDILQVYGELLRASRNHLRSFWKSAQRLGLDYTPQYITQAEFDAIVSSDYETGPTAPSRPQ